MNNRDFVNQVREIIDTTICDDMGYSRAFTEICALVKAETKFMSKTITVDGVEFIYDCIHTTNCWAYKYGGCAGNHSRCYAPPKTMESDEQDAVEKLKDRVRASLERFRFSSPIEFPKSIEILVSELRELLDQE